MGGAAVERHDCLATVAFSRLAAFVMLQDLAVFLTARHRSEVTEPNTYSHELKHKW